MQRDEFADLQERLTSASASIDAARRLIKETDLDYSTNIGRIAYALAYVLEIELDIYKRRPDLTPEHLKPEWQARPDAEWKREERLPIPQGAEYEHLDRLLTLAVETLTSTTDAFGALDFRPGTNSGRVANAVAQIDLIQKEIYERRPDLLPSHLERPGSSD